MARFVKKISIDEDFDLALETSILKQLWASKHEGILEVNYIPLKSRLWSCQEFHDVKWSLQTFNSKKTYCHFSKHCIATVCECDLLNLFFKKVKQIISNFAICPKKFGLVCINLYYS